MGSVILHHGTGAQDFELLEPSMPEQSEADIFFNVRRVLTHRGQHAAMDLLGQAPFKLFRSTNHFNDDFHVLYAEVPLAEYEAFLGSRREYRDPAKKLAETVAEVEGPWIRFVVIGLDLETISRHEAPPPGESPEEWDVFISYASEDRDTVAAPLADLLSAFGLRVWFDQTELKVGDSLRQKIDTALARSRYGVVILSKDFFGKHYPKRELDGLAQREVDDRNVILPIWHEVTETDVRGFSPPLAGRVASKWAEGAEVVAWKLLEVVRPEVIDELREAGKRIKALAEISSGRQLAGVIEGSDGYNFANDDLGDELEGELIGGFFQELEDWGEISGVTGIGAKVQEELRFDGLLEELWGAGWKVFGRVARRKVVLEEKKVVLSVANIAVTRHYVREVVEAGDGRFVFFRGRPDEGVG